MANEHKLPYTAEEIEEKLGMIGEGVPVIIDLDTYGGGTLETSVTAALVNLVFAGGGEMSDVPMGNLFSDLTTDRPIRVRVSFPFSDSTWGQITVDSVTTIRMDGQVIELYLNAQSAMGGQLVSVVAYINCGGYVAVSPLTPGADTTAIAADMEAILNAEY